MKNKIYIRGAGGFAIEVCAWAEQSGFEVVAFVDESPQVKGLMGIPVINRNGYDIRVPIIVAIGNPRIRRKIITTEYSNATFATIIHPSAIVGKIVDIGAGSIICPNVVITSKVKIGEHAHLNLATTVGHGCEIGSFFTTAPGAKISGDCKIGDGVYFGTNSSIKQKLTVVDDVIIGLGAGVLKNITQSGTYIGVPAVGVK